MVGGVPASRSQPGGVTNMEASFERNVEPAAPESGWWIYVLLGVGFIILGALAIVLPLAAAFAVSQLIGILLLIGGGVHFVFTLKRHESVGKVALGIVVSALYVIAGLILLAYPFAALLSLTLFLAAFLVVAGIFKVIAAVQAYGTAHWGWTLAGGLLTLVLGVLMWTQWPGFAVWAVGLLVGIDLIFMGWTAITVGIGMHMLSGTGRLAGQH